MFNVNRSFKNDIAIMKEKLDNYERFSFSKFADGEWSVMEGKSLDNTEFSFNSEADHLYRQALINSFQFKHKNYYVGVSCPCCQDIKIHNKMKWFSGQQEEHLTWANIWVNSNYGYFLNEILPTFDKYDIFIVANENSQFERLPFTPKKIYPVSNNAWKNNQGTIDEIRRDIQQAEITRDVKNYLFLFCCGPFGNILCHQLTEFCDKYTYLDIGSTLNPFLGTGFFRGYYRDYQTMKDCTWG
jgi:hypothetical protein